MSFGDWGGCTVNTLKIYDCRDMESKYTTMRSGESYWSDLARILPAQLMEEEQTWCESENPSLNHNAHTQTWSTSETSKL